MYQGRRQVSHEEEMHGPVAGRAAFAAFALMSLSACDVMVGMGGFGGKELAKDQWTRTYQLAPGGQLEIANTRCDRGGGDRRCAVEVIATDGARHDARRRQGSAAEVGDARAGVARPGLR